MAFLIHYFLKALEVAEVTGKLDKECFMFLVRKDRHKFSRVNRLIKANEELKRVQNTFLSDDQAMNIDK
jgi:hypothetical protein